MIGAINWLIDEMHKKFPGFGLHGEMFASGEDFPDLWKVVIRDGRAERVEVTVKGDLMECPDCGHKWIVE